MVLACAGVLPGAIRRARTYWLLFSVAATLPKASASQLHPALLDTQYCAILPPVIETGTLPVTLVIRTLFKLCNELIGTLSLGANANQSAAGTLSPLARSSEYLTTKPSYVAAAPDLAGCAPPLWCPAGRLMLTAR